MKEYWSEYGLVNFKPGLNKAYICTGKHTVSVCPQGAGFTVKVAFYGDIQTYHMEGMPLVAVGSLLADVEGGLQLAHRFYGVH